MSQDDIYQSAYKQLHSTETALVRVNNDILVTLDNHQSLILLLLDLSAAFDSVDHGILLDRLVSVYVVWLSPGLNHILAIDFSSWKYEGKSLHTSH